MTLSILLLASFSTLQSIGKVDLFDSNVNQEMEIIDHSPSIEQSSGQYTYGTYKTEIRNKIKPGRYHVKVDPVGENISMHIFDSSHNRTIKFNSTTEFNIDIDSTIVFIKIVVYDPISYQNWTRDQTFEVTLKRINQGSSLPVLPLWVSAVIGGVYLAVQSTYRKEPE